MKKLIAAISFFVLISCGPQKEEVLTDEVIRTELLIKNGMVYNGVDNNPREVDILILNDQIAKIGDALDTPSDSTIIIDASGKVVSPGFIDPHTHAMVDLENPSTSHNLPFLSQGITTVITGSDGRSPIPITSAFEKWEKHGIGTNALMLIGHGQVRLNVLGDEDRAPTADELEEMKDMVETGMKDGAFGLSTGLYYAPGFFAKTEEIIELSKVVANYGGIYDTHQRDESSYTIGLLASVEEVIRIGREAKLPVHISHIKALGADVWNKSDEVIKLITDAQNEGIDVTANQYPYIASGTSITAATLPRWVQAGGDEMMIERLSDDRQLPKIREEMKENIRRRGGAGSLLLITPKNESWKNRTLDQLSNEWKLPPEESAIKIIKEGGSGVASFNMTEDDLRNFMSQPWVVTGSDGSLNHPRKYGTFPRKFAKYVRQDSVLSLGEAIIQSTSKTADILKIPLRGRLEKGYFADLVIFDPTAIRDKAWFNNPEEFSVGIDYVIVNGQITIKNGNYQGNLAGRALKKEPLKQ